MGYNPRFVMSWPVMGGSKKADAIDSAIVVVSDSDETPRNISDGR